MAARSSNGLFLPVFGGQGTLTFDTENATRQLLQYTSFPSGAVLLDACYEAFHEEFATLTPEILEQVDICALDFKDKVTLFYPLHRKDLVHPIISGSSLLLVHALQYLAYIEGSPEISGSSNRFLDILQQNADHGVGVLGFSSGILSASVAATSRTAPAFISHAVEAYRLAFWIGVRSQLFRNSMLRLPYSHQGRPWAIVVFAVSQQEIQERIRRFNESFNADLLHIAAVVDDSCVTISGHPDDLALFTQTLPDEALIHETNINALYHCPARLCSVRNAVLGDVSSRGIKFPDFEDLLAPIRSTFTGDVITRSISHGSLVELVVNMVIMHPVHWHIVIERSVACIPVSARVQLINIGLGKSLVKGLEQVMSIRGVKEIDFQDLSDGGTRHIPEVKQEPIAIIGMAINMPGAQTAGELWKILTEGKNTAEEIPSHRFKFSDYTDRYAPGRGMKSCKANFINSVDEFDHRFFNISPREAKSMDPQQRILLQVAYEALENAGYVPTGDSAFSPETFGCYIGASTRDYIHNLRNNIDVYYSTGTLAAFLSGRLSYCLGLSGPSIVVDTACSSSMVAIYQAARSLMNRDCNAAIAGGVNVISSPDMFLGLDRGHFLSPSGQCKAFDAAADGYSRAEGCGVFILKRLSDAISENDQILGIIRGVEVNQSGQAPSITRPHVPTQEALFQRVLRCSDIDANSVNLVEAHGTGTQAGDINEMESIRHVLAFDRSSDNPLFVTTIKANIGHLEAASGCASLAKVLLMFRHKTIPQQISLKTLNPRIAPLDMDNTVISTSNIAWPSVKTYKPRRALINNFGASGSNATLLVEEYMPIKGTRASTEVSSYVFVLSAKDEVALNMIRSTLTSWLRDPQNETISLLNLSYTLTARRQLYAHRLAFSAGNKQELITRLNNMLPVEVKPGLSSPVVFVFSGQGTHYRGMASSAYRSSSIFRRCIDECDSILTSSRFSGILSIITGVPEAGSANLDGVEDFQSAGFSLQYALGQLWLSWGIRPSAVVGHSLGEYVALVIAGAVNLRDALLLVATRAHLMFERCTIKATSMVAVSLGPVKVQAILDSSRQGLSNLCVSCFNSPNDCVVSGPIAELKMLKIYLEGESACRCTLLNVPFGYHSPAMDPVIGELSAVAKSIKIRPPSLPFISTVLGRLIMPGDQNWCGQNYFTRHCAEPVRFAEGVESYLSDPILNGNKATWLEIGPHPALLPMLETFPCISNSQLLTSLHKQLDCWISFSKTLASLSLVQTIYWKEVFAQIGPTSCLVLPSYPFSTRKFWIPYQEHSPSSVKNRHIDFSFIRNWDRFPTMAADDTAVLETTVDHVRSYIDGHRVGGVPLCPASVYLELASSATTLTLRHLDDYPKGFTITLREIAFSKPLTHNFEGEKHAAPLKIAINTSAGTFAISTSTFSCLSEATHAEGKYDLVGNQEIRDQLEDLLPFVVHCTQDILHPANNQRPEKFSTRTTYQVIFPRVVEYSKQFHTMQSLAMSSDGMEAVTSVQLEVGTDSGIFVTHPLFLDTLIHAPGFVCNLHGGQTYAYICNEIASLIILSPAVDKGANYTIYCKIVELPDQSGMIGDSYAILEAVPRILVAHANGIRFQRVLLSGLKASLSSLSGIINASSLGEGEFTLGKRSQSDTQTTVVDIVAKACNLDLDYVYSHGDLRSYGIDSLMLLELCYDLSKAFPAFGYRPEEIADCKDVQGIIDLISSNSYSEQSYSAGYSSVHSTSKTMVSTGSPALKRVFARVLDIDEEAIGEDIELGSLGLDSLSSIEASHLLSTHLRLTTPANFLSPRRTIGDIGRQLFPTGCFPFSLPESAQSHSSTSSMDKVKEVWGLDRRVWPLQTPNSSRTPLILIHDGSGLAVSYQRILNLDRCVFAINNPNFITSHPWVTITQMAESYAAFILEKMTGPVLLGGWSFGGVVAFEISKILEARSVLVKGVILIDSPNPFVHVPLSTLIIDQVLDTSKGVDPEIRTLCRSQFEMNAKLLSKYDPYETRNYGNPRLVLLRSTENYEHLGQMDVPSWLSDRGDRALSTNGWELLSGQSLNVIDIPGNHFQPFEPENIVTVSRRIADACELLDI